MNTQKKHNQKRIREINMAQRDFFSNIIDVFEPPLPIGVPARLRQIVASGGIKKGDTVLDVGSGTGILVPVIKEYNPEKIYACDLSETMLEKLKSNYPYACTIVADVRDLDLPDSLLDVVIINACYPNIVDKKSAFANISRMLKKNGSIIISHPMGKNFIDLLRKDSPFPLDDFPDQKEADNMLSTYGFNITEFIDEPKLYILRALKKNE